MPSVQKQTYAQRASKHANPAAKALLETIERKKSNLCVSVDVTKQADFLRIIDVVGPYICLVKTHIDVVEDFEPSLIDRLKELSMKHDFLIFEDRKFADIGNTVALQYSSGVYRISSWSHITNAHPVPGPGIVTGLASVGQPLGRGLLLLAEMSTKGNLATGAYTAQAVEIARAHRDFVIGFIAMRRMSEDNDEDFLILTPGVGLDSKGDAMGQQYRTPREVVFESGCDVIIVGRGIYGKGGDEEVKAQAERYRKEGWAAYEERIRA
ncbi:Orotidine 5'-phosphate decarboxylase domain-containing protein [Rhodofomes roseus]|uniref:Orotidine 5'-phosphate decarboxylase n=1 Tax=Rhodofomes roseus TaxID=34475 RepID=A0ABQ8KY52_9APHY|nr:Orotidine 5'-phosphate decarboxylase domain-containing protein [Rhodofomes roseus]KAH9844232.1 Orotidine 5'-phosphate decarboxylase domain-containing protein [Rhodofomes roseus]